MSKQTVLATPNPDVNPVPKAGQRVSWLLMARIVWVFTAAGLLVNFIIALPVYYGRLRVVCSSDPADCGSFWLPTPANVQALRSLGLSVEVYAVGFISFVVAVSLVFLVVGALIFWRKSDERLGLLVSLLLILFGCFGFIDQLQTTNFATLALPLPFQVFINLMAFAQYPALALFLLTFPTGRIAPRWTWVIVLVWVAETIIFDLPAPYGFPNWPGWLEGVDLFVVWGGPVIVQVYRYRRIYSRVQRQQTKSVVFGFAVGLLVVTLASLLGAAVPGLDTPDSPYQLLNGVFVGVFFVSIPLSIGVAILRYRLWDIDSIINRALVYGLLTTLLGALYASLTIGLEGFALTITGTANQPVALIISTLVIAALSQPLRKRLQSFIDRRFYRKKYDAEKTLATFSATLREALDLEEIREQLIAVVQETMQPAQVSLWLRTPERPTGELLDHLDLRGWPPLFLKTGG